MHVSHTLKYYLTSVTVHRGNVVSNDNNESERKNSDSKAIQKNYGDYLFERIACIIYIR